MSTDNVSEIGSLKDGKPSSQPPLVFLHGLFGSQTTRPGVAKSLKEAYLVDLRCHVVLKGSPFNYHTLQEDVAGFIRQRLKRDRLLWRWAIPWAGRRQWPFHRKRKLDLVSGLVSVDAAPVAPGCWTLENSAPVEPM